MTIVNGVIGHDCKIYVNTASWASPTWAEVTIAINVKLSDPTNLVEKMTRGSDFKKYRPGLRDPSLEMDIDNIPGDANFVLIQAAKTGRTPIEFAIMDGDITVSATAGFRGVWEVENFEQDQQQEAHASWSATFKPSCDDGGNEFVEFVTP